MIDFLTGYAVPFLIVLTVVVFFHELGHFWVARRCGVRVEVFSIGFGPELFGWTDRHGTRWKFSALPFGGYVKMFGQAERVMDEAGAERDMTADEQAVSFHHKTIPQRAAIVAAGPIANFVLAVIVFGGVLATQEFVSNLIGTVVPGSAAEAAGFRPGDRIVEMNGWPTRRFEHIAMEVQVNGAAPMMVTVVRGGELVVIAAQPALTTRQDDRGRMQQVFQLGIQPSVDDGVSFSLGESALYAVEDTYRFTVFTLRIIGKMVTGERSSGDLGGPLRIGEVAGDAAKVGLLPMINLIAHLSISLGLLNLFPIPLLDGGHLVFYLIEAVRGRPLGERAQEMGMRIGLALILGLMVFATWNDLKHLRVVDFIKNLVT